MKRFWLLLCSGALVCGAGLPGVHTVYFLPMSRGLDQYLANRVNTEHLFQVVTDPTKADAIFTDSIGEGFETQMDVLLPPPAPPAAAKDAKDTKNDKETKDAKTAKASSEAGDDTSILPTDTVNKLANPAAYSAFGRGRGTVFLVDAKTRAVVWSTYAPPKNTTSKELDRTASDIVSRLKRDLNPAKK